jgi:hypothetical protein
MTQIEDRKGDSPILGEDRSSERVLGIFPASSPQVSFAEVRVISGSVPPLVGAVSTFYNRMATDTPSRIGSWVV